MVVYSTGTLADPSPRHQDAWGPSDYPSECECEALLTDGTSVSIRPIRPNDARLLHSFHEQLSAQTVYKRYFNSHRHLREDEIERLTCVDYRSRLALVAEAGGRLLGVGRYEGLPAGSSAEVAFVVADEVQGHGLGTLLLEHLAVAARQRGIVQFEADTLNTNHAMLDVFRDVGFKRKVQWDDGVAHVTFPIAPTQAYLDAVLARHFLSARAWLERIEQTGEGGPPVTHQPRLSPTVLAVAGSKVSKAFVGGDPGLILAGLASESTDQTIVVELHKVLAPGRFIATARAASRRAPIIALDPSGRFRDVCRQAGIERVAIWTDAPAAASRPAGGAFPPCDRASLVETPQYDSHAARQVLDKAIADLRPSTGPVELYPGIASKLLEICQIPGHRAPTISITEDSGGLAVRTPAKSGQTTRAFLPLTRGDLADLTEDPDAVANLARLMVDLPEIRHLEIAQGRPRIVVGPPRTHQDDPFVRRLVQGHGLAAMAF